MMVIQLVTYTSIAIALIAIIAKVIKYATAPEHLRWELYPVPHEKGRAEYGGSYLEELDWWSKPRHSDMFKELKEMMLEIFFLKGVFHHNKRVWSSSLPFHLGLYLSMGWLTLLLIGAILGKIGLEISAVAGIWGSIVHYLTVITGYAGLILTGLGAFGLFIWRISDSAQRPYNSPMEYMNLLLFDLTITVALITHLSGDPSFAALRAYVSSLITFSAAPAMSTIMIIEILLVSLLILFIPTTRMSHFVAKYFLYHSVRWNDEPTERGSKLEKSLTKLMSQKVDWKASHISTGKSWVEVVKEVDSE